MIYIKTGDRLQRLENLSECKVELKVFEPCSSVTMDERNIEDGIDNLTGPTRLTFPAETTEEQFYRGDGRV